MGVRPTVALRSVWILCHVVDHFGDAGVSWRLARQLAHEHGLMVTLWIDHAPTLRAIAPSLDELPGQIDGIEVMPLARTDTDRIAPTPAPDVLISAFGAEPPAWLRASLTGGHTPPLWVNLEYLSAQTWIESCHGQVSIKPQDGAREHFYFPGFTTSSGGLLRERGLLDDRDAFRGGPARQHFLAGIGALPEPGQRLITLFCYPEVPLASWLDALRNAAVPTLLCVAGHSAEAALQGYLGRHAPHAHSDTPNARRTRVGALQVLRLPMLSQADYDRLLWSADLNLVRGEDSWVRAQWAARPFLWQAYRQDEGAHLVKLEAFLGRLRAVLDGDNGLDALAELMRLWNDPETDQHAMSRAWAAFDNLFTAQTRLAQRWAASLGGQTDLATRLVRYCLDRLQCQVS